MAYEAPQESGLGIYSVGIGENATGLQIYCSMDNNMLQGAEADADAFFQAFVDHMATMPGVTLQSPTKSKNLTQSVSVTPIA